MIALVTVQVWQSSEDALLQMVVVVVVRLAAENNMLPGWDDLGTGGQLLLVRHPSFFMHFQPTLESSTLMSYVHRLHSDLNRTLITFNAISNIMFIC